MPPRAWRAVILAAGRGSDDPMAKAFGVAHKCAIAAAGKPMLVRVIDALIESGISRPFYVSIDEKKAISTIAGVDDGSVAVAQSAPSAPASAMAAITTLSHFPVLITTGDHALLTAEMVRFMTDASVTSGADFTVGLATAETILHAYPEAQRTFFKLGSDRVSGCNLFAVMNANGLRVLDHWQQLERNRKKPWKLVATFGIWPLLQFLSGQLTLAKAFAQVSARLGVAISPVLLPFAEAAIDVDKPDDHALAEVILRARATTRDEISMVATSRLNPSSRNT